MGSRDWAPSLNGDGGRKLGDGDELQIRGRTEGKSRVERSTRDGSRTPSGNDEGIACLKVLSAPNRFYRYLCLETQLLQHGLMFEEYTLESFWGDKIRRRTENGTYQGFR